MSTDRDRALLAKYVRMAIAETAHLARVPNQLVEPDNAEAADDGDVEEVNEFSGVGGIAGYTAPLGMDPDLLGRQKNKRKK